MTCCLRFIGIWQTAKGGCFGRSRKNRNGRPLIGGAVSNANDQPLMRGDSPVVLIVDDEPSIATLAGAILQKLGFVTLTANSAAAAIETWKEHGPQIDVLLTDLAMPERRGDELGVELLKANPKLLVIVMSGNPMQPGECLVPLIEGVNLLRKPFTRDALIHVLRTNSIYLPRQHRSPGARE